MNVLLYTLKRKGREVLGAEVKEIDLPNETSARLKTMYEVMNCDMVEHIAFEYRGEEYDLWCDEEFLLKEYPIATLLIGYLKPNRFTVICGNFIISRTQYTEEGADMGSLSKADMRKLRGFIDEGQLKLRIAFAEGLIGCHN